MITRRTIAAIGHAAALPAHPPNSSEAWLRPGTAMMTTAILAIEAEPFQALLGGLSAYFDGDIEAALAEDEPAALAAAERIIAEHVRKAAVRLSAPTPVIYWTDHIALSGLVSDVARRAADLRFTQMLDA